jgi:phage-related tail protein
MSENNRESNDNSLHIDDHLKVQKEESSMRLQNVEDTLDKIDTSLSEHEKVLTETSSRLLNLENNRARDKTHNVEVNKTLDKFCEKFAE